MDQWHNRLHLAALQNSIIGNFFSIVWKSLAAEHNLGAHACSEGYGSRPMCVWGVCVGGWGNGGVSVCVCVCESMGVCVCMGGCGFTGG